MQSISAHLPGSDRAEAALRAHIGDTARQIGALLGDERLHGLIERPMAN
ncbi:hypothetical protein T8T21_17075 (plasmid) [Limimaricola variabilis]|nr:hypothetical protein [Limimaricola variabilis]WPY96221.1 hypothetical protein T8T21_17075 [Limimaricola variabilis]